MATRQKEQFGQQHWTNLNKLGMFQKQKESNGGWRVVKKTGSTNEQRPSSREAVGNLEEFDVSKAKKRGRFWDKEVKLF